MSKRLGFGPPILDPERDRLFRKSVARALTNAEIDAQRRSFVHGETGRDPDTDYQKGWRDASAEAARLADELPSWTSTADVARVLRARLALRSDAKTTGGET